MYGRSSLAFHTNLLINYGLNQYSFHQAGVLYLIKDAAEDKYLEN